MRDLWDIQKQEEIVGQKIEEYENADTIPEDQLSEEGKKALQKAKEKMGGEVQGAEALLRHKNAATQGRSRSRSKSQAANRMQAEAIKVAQQLEDATEEAETWGNTIGTGEKSPPGQKLELGRRLAGNEKLKKLARMVGRMKFHAQALRKKVFERSSEELLEVEQGDCAPSPVAARVTEPAPSGLAKRFLPPLSRPGIDPILAPRHRRKRQRADDRLPRRQFVDVRRQRDLV